MNIEIDKFGNKRYVQVRGTFEVPQGIKKEVHITEKVDREIYEKFFLQNKNPIIQNNSKRDEFVKPMIQNDDDDSSLKTSAKILIEQMM